MISVRSTADLVGRVKVELCGSVITHLKGGKPQVVVGTGSIRMIGPKNLGTNSRGPFLVFSRLNPVTLVMQCSPQVLILGRRCRVLFAIQLAVRFNRQLEIPNCCFIIQRVKTGMPHGCDNPGIRLALASLRRFGDGDGFRKRLLRFVISLQSHQTPDIEPEGMDRFRGLVTQYLPAQVESFGSVGQRGLGVTSVQFQHRTVEDHRDGQRMLWAVVSLGELHHPAIDGRCFVIVTNAGVGAADVAQGPHGIGMVGSVDSAMNLVGFQRQGKPLIDVPRLEQSVGSVQQLVRSIG